MFEGFFKFKANGTNLKRDTLAGLTTFIFEPFLSTVTWNRLSQARMSSLKIHIQSHLCTRVTSNLTPPWPGGMLRTT